MPKWEKEEEEEEELPSSESTISLTIFSQIPSAENCRFQKREEVRRMLPGRIGSLSNLENAPTKNMPIQRIYKCLFAF